MEFSYSQTENYEIEKLSSDTTLDNFEMEKLSSDTGYFKKTSGDQQGVCMHAIFERSLLERL